MNKILHVITTLDEGGAESSLYRLVINDSLNIHIVVSLKGEGKYGPLLKQNNIEVFALNLSANLGVFYKMYYLYKIIKITNPSVIQTWMYHADLIGGVLGKMCRVQRIVWGIHNGDVSKENLALSTFLVVKLNALICKFVPDAIVCCAKTSMSTHQKIYNTSSQFTVIANGYDTDKFFIDDKLGRSIREEFEISSDHILLGMVARFDPVKNHGLMLESFNQLHNQDPNMKLLLVGSGVDKSNTKLIEEIQSRNLGGSIILAGSRSDIPSIMNAINLLVLASLSEAFPNVLCEALSCGTICVATDVGDCKEIIGPFGKTCVSNDPAALVDAILDVCLNHNLATPCYEARESISMNYTVHKMCERYQIIWFPKRLT